MSKGYDKTFKQSYKKAVKLSERDKCKVYVIKVKDGYQAVSEITLAFVRYPEILEVVNES